jgi:hypothetical protein
VVDFATWLLNNRDIGLHDVTLRLEDFARAAYSRGAEAATKRHPGMVQGRHTEDHEYE